jgi:hypothetical protein
MSGIYVYAVIPSHRRAFDVPGIWSGDPLVRTLAGERVAAVIGAAPPISFQALSREDALRYLLAHQRVVEEIMRDTPALPVKFGTTLADEDAVGCLLESGAEVLTARLAELAFRSQIELIVTWSMEEVLREVALEPAISSLRSEVAAQSPEPTAELRIALGKLVKKSIDHRREVCRDRIVSALRPIVADLAHNARMDEGMVTNLALLLPESAQELLDQRLAELDEEFGGRLKFRCVGPLPPYSFATVEVIAPSFEAIDRARRTLSLGDSAKLADIKEAYRRQMQQRHPDRVGDQLCIDDASQLTDAYRTLTHYASALSSMADGDRRESACRFDRAAVEGSILVAVRRQELTDSGGNRVP